MKTSQLSRSRTLVGSIRTFAVAATLAIASLSCNVTIAQWNQFGGAQGNFRIEASELNGPGHAWSIPVEASDSQSIVDGDRIFLTSADFTDEGLDATRVLCVDRQSGKTLWKQGLLGKQFYVSRYPRSLSSTTASKL